MNIGKYMKRLFLLPLVALLPLSFQASACLTIKDSYSGTIPANGTVIAYGPFTIGSTCTTANIASTVAAVGTGSAPQLYIDKLAGGSWVQVAGNTGTTASYLGAVGTYRVREVNATAAVKTYNGTTSYGH